MSAGVQYSMGRLRTKMLRAAQTFPDYNFRNYFVRHVKDQFAAMERWSVDEQRRFLEQEAANKLCEMRRMALVNRMFTTQPVFLDKRAARHSKNSNQTAKKEEKS